MTYKNFESLPIWQDSINIADIIFKLTYENNLFRKDFVLKDQINRSALSISSNIAEGFERDSKKEFIRFLKISKGSCGELRSQILIAKNRNYIDEAVYKVLNDRCLNLGSSIAGFINYLKK